MRRTSFEQMDCPIARTLERVGDWWNILILRDAFLGSTRFEQFQTNLGVAPNILSRRLRGLTEAGMLERRLYQVRPARYEYTLTEVGLDFRPVLWTLLAYGNRHFAPEGPSVMLVDRATGAPADPVLVDGNSGRRITPNDFRSVPGPAASAATRRLHGTHADRGAERQADLRSAGGNDA
jgi:DNA-binding HxlR family transcriptional regulator